MKWDFSRFERSYSNVAQQRTWMRADVIRALVGVVKEVRADSASARMRDVQTRRSRPEFDVHFDNRMHGLDDVVDGFDGHLRVAPAGECLGLLG